MFFLIIWNVGGIQNFSNVFTKNFTLPFSYVSADFAEEQENCWALETQKETKECIDKLNADARQRSGVDNVHGVEKAVRDVLYVAWMLPMSVLLRIGALLAEFFLNPDIFNRVFSSANSEWMYGLWSVVRDLLNIFLILVLLLSAFSTIFQIQKWHLKNTLLMIVLMALLVKGRSEQVMISSRWLKAPRFTVKFAAIEQLLRLASRQIGTLLSQPDSYRTCSELP